MLSEAPTLVPHGDDRLRADSESGLTTIFDSVMPPAQAASRERSPQSAFDVCHGGLVLRAVLFVHGIVAVALSFTSSGWMAWVLDVAAAAAMALPATLLWLVVACASRRALARLEVAAQWIAAVALGAVCAAAGWGWVAWLAPDARGGLGWPAPMLAGAAISAAIFHWLRLRAGMQLPATTTARLTELQSRIRPHFLFNTLNSAIVLVRADPPKAEEVLEDLAELFRSALTESGQVVTLGEEIELARRYLAIEQVRFGARLKVHWDLDAAAAPALLPPLLLQPLVENAVKHGVEPATEPGLVRVRTRVKNRQAVIHVTNSIPAGPPRPGHGIALRNVRERLRLLHDVAAHFDAGVSEPGVYRVRIVLPLPD